MTGFIRGLFGGNKANNNSEAFFLDEDTAKGLGDVEFMRTPKTVKKSYPKAAGSINVITGEEEVTVSSINKMDRGEAPKPKSIETSTQPTTTTATSSYSVPPRRSSGDLDMFRQMAKNMKK
ncbi:MAG: hypothetical protein ACRDB1_13005 [Microcoleaceae cyanobacterium]